MTVQQNLAGEEASPMDTWGKSLAGGIAKAEVLTRMPGQRLPSNRTHGLPRRRHGFGFYSQPDAKPLQSLE